MSMKEALVALVVDSGVIAWDQIFTKYVVTLVKHVAPQGTRVR